MTVFELVKGSKGELDCIVLLRANREPLSFSEWIFLGVMYMKSEDQYYPKSQGFKGGDLLIEALLDARKGMSIPEVCQKYKLEYKVNVR